MIMWAPVKRLPRYAGCSLLQLGPAYVPELKIIRAGQFKTGFEWNAPDWKDINNADTSAVGFKKGRPWAQMPPRTWTHSSLPGGRVEPVDRPINLQDGTAFLKEGEVATDCRSGTCHSSWKAWKARASPATKPPAKQAEH